MRDAENIVHRSEIEVHELTNDPDEAWRSLKAAGRRNDVFKPMPLDTPIKDDYIRFVCVCDTHNHMDKCTIPPGDVFLFAGDFSYSGSKQEIDNFCALLAELPQKIKIVIAGNHELSFDPPENPDEKPRMLLERAWNEFREFGIKNPRDCIRTAFIWRTRHSRCLATKSSAPRGNRGIGVGLPRGKAILEKWNKIPDDTDILLVHAPPVGHGDFSKRVHKHQGCVELLNSIEQRIKPKYVVFGHIHEGFGCTTNGETVFINSAFCDLHREPAHSAVIFDLPLKNGFRK